jgi:hypothetical protein
MQIDDLYGLGTPGEVDCGKWNGSIHVLKK